ncbi:unnamed protein product [marine sediment metagenome]|uniref:Uncharacterized protein n=1 Tax=marine sediment metagenome TaxID=412755 RepID=X0VCS6_9ZZZZ
MGADIQGDLTTDYTDWEAIMGKNLLDSQSEIDELRELTAQFVAAVFMTDGEVDENDPQTKSILAKMEKNGEFLRIQKRNRRSGT